MVIYQHGEKAAFGSVVLREWQKIGLEIKLMRSACSVCKAGWTSTARSDHLKRGGARRWRAGSKNMGAVEH